MEKTNHNKYGMNILITGANGFIGRALCSRLASDNKVVGIDITGPSDGALNIAWERTDLNDSDSVAAFCEKYSPDVVIHCAGIAHQKIGAVDSATYMRVNSEATENLAKAAVESNPDIKFIFVSSVSVYGEENLSMPVSEENECHPSSDYAVSKLDAERRLIALSDEGIVHNLVILRLAPVYDREWSLNLDRRVFAPKKLAYLRFGSGSQKMSALARPNLVEFIEFLLKSKLATDTHRHIERIKGKNTGANIFNVCDAEAYEFNRIIRVFKKSGVQPDRPVITVPLYFVWIATRVAGIFLPGKRNWLHSCYDKLASDLVFDTGKMMGTGFRPVHSLKTIFRPQTRLP